MVIYNRKRTCILFTDYAIDDVTECSIKRNSFQHSDAPDEDTIQEMFGREEVTLIIVTNQRTPEQR